MHEQHVFGLDMPRQFLQKSKVLSAELRAQPLDDGTGFLAHARARADEYRLVVIAANSAVDQPDQQKQRNCGAQMCAHRD